MQKQKGTIRHWMVIITCMMICIGPSAVAFNVAPVFYAPVSEYLGVGMGTFGIYMTCTLLACTAYLPLAGKIFATKDARLVLSASVLAVALSIMAMSLFTEVWMFYIAGVFIGLGEATLLYLAVPVLINRWFVERVGFWVGFCMAFAGIGGFVLNLTSGQIIQNVGWQTGYLVNGFIALIALPFTLLAVRSNPSDCGLLPVGAPLGGNAVAADEKAADAFEVTGVDKRVAFRSPAFYMIVCMTICMSLGTCLYQFMPAYCSTLPAAIAVPTIGATVASSAMAGQAIGKIVLGLITDKGARFGLWIAAGAGMVSIAMLLFGGGAMVVLIAAGFIFGWFYASISVQTPLVVREAFGSKDYAEINSRNSMVMSLCSAFGATIWGFVIDYIGYQFMWTVGIALAAVMIIMGTLGLRAAKKLPRVVVSQDTLGA